MSTFVFASVAFNVRLLQAGAVRIGRGVQGGKLTLVRSRTSLERWSLRWTDGIRDSLGADVSHIQTRTPAEFDENFRQYGAKGFNLVIGHGFEFQDAALRVAPTYPNTVYITTSGTSVAANVGGAEFAFEDASYLAGIVAGGMTKSNTLGMIGGTELPPVKRSFAAFEKGARSVNPQVKVVISYIGNWDDVSAGKEQAIALIARGADIIFQNADAAGLGVFQAVKEAPGISQSGPTPIKNDIVPKQHLAASLSIYRTRSSNREEVQKPGFKGRVFSLASMTMS